MIYVCIPVRDEEATIGLLLWKIRSVLIELGRDFEIVVLDDASSDGTPAALERYRRVLPLKIHRADVRLGYARALERILRDVTQRAAYPKRDVVVTLQGDFSDDPRDMVALIKTVEGGADLVAATPGVQEMDAPRPVRWARWFAPRVMGAVWARSPVTDPSTGFRAYRAIVLRKMLADHRDAPLMSRDGWAANVELLGLAAPHARRIEEEHILPNHGLKQRSTRFSALGTVRDLARLRGSAFWVHAGSES